MATNTSDVTNILLMAIRTIRSAPNVKEGWDRAFDAVELLKRMGPDAVDGLINALYSNDTAVMLLTMIYLGILRDEGVHQPSKAIETIYEVVDLDDPNIVQIASLTALTLLGDGRARELVSQLMPGTGVYDEHEFHMKTMVSVANYIRRGV